MSPSPFSQPQLHRMAMQDAKEDIVNMSLYYNEREV